LALSSIASTEPSSATPAKMPSLREYDSTCAFRLESVVAAAVRPTGPAATLASAPSVTLPSAMPSTLSRDVSTSMTSVDCTPH
jgi:hypothetical protein